MTEWKIVSYCWDTALSIYLWQLLSQVAREPDMVKENCDLLSYPQKGFRARIKIG